MTQGLHVILLQTYTVFYNMIIYFYVLIPSDVLYISIFTLFVVRQQQ